MADKGFGVAAMIKSMMLCGPLVLGALYMGGAFGSGEYTRDVGRPPAEVLASLEDLDIRDQPGAPGTDASRAGGVQPLFRMSRTATSIRWSVMSGNRVATTMVAELEPLDGGKRTRVVARVERGDAPDDVVPPAFRSERLTLGLFSMALEGELGELTRPAVADQAACDELESRFAAGGIAAAGRRRADGAERTRSEGFGEGARAILKVTAYAAERQRLGCREGGLDGSAPISSRMVDVRDDAGSDSDPVAGSRHDQRVQNPAVNFTPGQPMIDPRPPGERPGH